MTIRILDPRLESNVDEINRRLVLGGGEAHDRIDFINTADGEPDGLVLIDDANDDICVVWPADDEPGTDSFPYWQTEIYVGVASGFLPILRAMIHEMVALGRDEDVMAWAFDGAAQGRLMDRLKQRGQLNWQESTRAEGTLTQETVLADAEATIDL